MLLLPRLKIVRSDYREVEVIQKIRDWLEVEGEKRGDGIHASDLLDIRYAFFNKTNPQEIGEKQVFFFSIGKVLHALLLQAWDPGHDEFATDAGTSEAEGILYSPDSRRADGSPIELKSNRAMREPNPDRLQDEISSYLEQLVTYIVLDEKREGELWILYLNMLDETGRTHPAIRCYIVSLTDDQYELIREEIITNKEMLLDALNTNDPSSLPLCRTWRCGEKMCPHFKMCKPIGRFGIPKKNWKV